MSLTMDVTRSIAMDLSQAQPARWMTPGPHEWEVIGSGFISCRSCPLVLTEQAVREAHALLPEEFVPVYSTSRMLLADEAGRLREANRDLLVENAELRRQVERLQRKR